MKIIKLNCLQIFNGVAYHKGEDHTVSDSIAATAEKRGVLDGPARDVEVPAEAPATEVPATEVPAKSKK